MNLFHPGVMTVACLPDIQLDESQLRGDLGHGSYGTVSKAVVRIRGVFVTVAVKTLPAHAESQMDKEVSFFLMVNFDRFGSANIVVNEMK